MEVVMGFVVAGSNVMATWSNLAGELGPARQHAVCEESD